MKGTTVDNNQQAIQRLERELHQALEVQGEMGRAIAELTDKLGAVTKRLDAAMGDVQRNLMKVEASVASVQSDMASYIVVMADVPAKVEDLLAKVDGRNKSAATKRNMTDADALRVLNGDLKELDHKAAAEAIGLTYAQVYSARGGFTFKHVIHDLEKAGWKNPWDKPKRRQ